MAPAHFLELGFLEIRGHPKSSSGTIAINCWPARRVLAGVDILLADDAVDRRRDGGVLKIQARLIEIRLALRDLRLRHCNRDWVMETCCGPVMAFSTSASACPSLARACSTATAAARMLVLRFDNRGFLGVRRGFGCAEAATA